MELNIEEFKSYLNIVFKDEISKIVVSNKVSKTQKFKRVEVVKKTDKYFVSEYDEKQVFNKNLSFEQLIEYLCSQTNMFKQFDFFSMENQFVIKISKKQKIFFNRLKNQNANVVLKSLKTEKNYILKEGQKIAPLVDMGIFTAEGKVVASAYDKYKQINKFVEIIDDYVRENDFKSINIIDFGCGKSYLTFIVYYYFSIIKKIDCHIVGIDLKRDVIEECNRLAKKYNYQNLSFEVADINGYEAKFPVDMVISLHACDTATDFAIFNAIKWNAKMIFSVPCCQHEINSQISAKNFSILTRYGVAKERISAIYTDIIRCNLLESMGYKVQLLEFIDFAHTPKNLLIRAKLSNIPLAVKKQMLQEVKNLSAEFNLNQKLFDLLKTNNFLNDLD